MLKDIQEFCRGFFNLIYWHSFPTDFDSSQHESEIVTILYTKIHSSNVSKKKKKMRY